MRSVLLATFLFLSWPAACPLQAELSARWRAWRASDPPPALPLGLGGSWFELRFASRSDRALQAG